MRYISFRSAARSGVGIVDGDAVLPLQGIRGIGPTVDADALRAARVDERGRIALDRVVALPVSPTPDKVFCVGLNYRDHVEETGRDLPTYPVLFPKFASTLIGADDPIVLPPESQQVDYEGELAVVIGRAGRRILESEAPDHVLGYAVANDVTMRDYQYKTHQWMQGKAWDSSTPIGPYLVTPDEVDLDTAGIRTTLNSATVQESDLGRLIFSVPRLIAMISTFIRLVPGDVIMTGTPGGVGYRRHPQVFLRPGDTVEVTIEGVGRLTSEVIDQI